MQDQTEAQDAAQDTPQDPTQTPDPAATPSDPLTEATPATPPEQNESFELPAWVNELMADPLTYLQDKVLQPDFLIPVSIQLAVILAVLIFGIVTAPPVRRFVMSLLKRLPEEIYVNIDETTPRLVRPAIWAGTFWLAQTVMESAGYEETLVRISTSLATAWLIIRLATTFFPAALRKPIAWTAWIIAGLNVIGALDDVIRWSNTIGPTFADKKINPAFVLQAIFTAALFLYGASWLSKRLKTRVEDLPRVEPSLRILITNAIQIGLFFAAILLTLTGLGIPLGGLAILGGAIGVGLGFGMQQIVANFISGVILLTDRSIKPDDVIEVDDTYGVVKSLGLRYASVITRDGKEHLIPNEMLVTNKVVNWSFSDSKVRIKRRLRVEYETDLKLAVDLVVQGCSRVPRVLSDPAPKCLVMEFGDEAIEIEARFWIDDPQNGVANVGSDAMLSVWGLFKEHGIDIPLRHQDVLITPGSTLKVEMVRETKGKTENEDADDTPPYTTPA